MTDKRRPGSLVRWQAESELRTYCTSVVAGGVFAKLGGTSGAGGIEDTVPARRRALIAGRLNARRQAIERGL